MAFTRDTLTKIGGGVGGAPSMWSYVTADALASVDTADYFLLAADLLKVNDLIFLARTGTPAWAFVVVNANTGTAVDVTSVLANPVGAADSD
jgi:hypothetical protein